MPSDRMLEVVAVMLGMSCAAGLAITVYGWLQDPAFRRVLRCLRRPWCWIVGHRWEESAWDSLLWHTTELWAHCNRCGTRAHLVSIDWAAGHEPQREEG